MDILVVGPRDRKSSYSDRLVINTTSQSMNDWTREFSPFFLGPIPLYGDMTARCMENAWQYAKVYPQHVDVRGQPRDLYWQWAQMGWSARRACRYPMGRGARPAFSLWDGQKLGYVEARKRIYVPLYRDALAQTDAFRRLVEIAKERPIALWDFDGYDHRAEGVSLKDVLDDDTRPMGHAFVIKAMLLAGPDVTVEYWPDEVEPRPCDPELQRIQRSLFDENCILKP